MPQSILIIDPETDFLEWADRHLSNPQVKVHTAGTAEDGLKKYLAEKPDLVITEFHLKPVNGIEILKRIRQADPNAMVVLSTGFPPTNAVIEAMKLGAFDFLRKETLPFDLRPLVESALKSREAQRVSESVPEASFDLGDSVMIGRSQAMQSVFKIIGRVSRSEAAVMITGESGCGKEVVARAVQRYSLRSNKPFVAINCAAIPESLLESELFGHEKGAFTGATAMRVGRFEQCDGGTLFLDEIGEMPMHVQTKILRVLQEGEFSRVGGNETLKTDVRIIAATNRNLEKEVEVGRFREDLFYRLNVVRVHLPPLRERPEDIPLLARFFVDRLAKKRNNPRLRLSEDAYALMESYNWPGNVRELENTIQRATVLANTDVLTSRDIPLGLGIAPRPETTANPSALTNESAIAHLLDAAITLNESALPWIERLLAEEALRRENQDHSSAARRLGLKPAAFKKLLGPEV
ncbi:MAG: two component, sigma54 specific, transcriptional regulator, Fis family [Verrucomicrobiales bacterium]|nr:two component, sigma54 specific, transcriptional regulator, Fis family [Verrucomicrobiales bacterium]